MVYYDHMEQPGPDDDHITKVLAGDKDSFRYIVEKYGYRVISFCRSRLGAEEDARDVAQDVFMRAYSSLHTFRIGESFPSWLFAIASNRVRSQFSLFAINKKKIEAAGKESLAIHTPDPSELAIEHFESENLLQAVRKLPSNLRWPIEFYYFAELSVAETGRILGLREEAVKTRLFRGRKMLKTILDTKQPNKSSGGTHP
jgi:RNA polymerase sigma-70 factor (ECF subfamily)